jgi:signal transduction histidine kinase
VLIDSRSRATDGEQTASDTDPRRSLLAGVRTRVLVSFLALLVLSTAASVFVLREVLLSRIGDQVERELAPQVDALEAVSESGQPGSGEPFTGIGQLFDAYLAQAAAPPDGALIAFADGGPYRTKVSDPGDGALGAAFDDLATTTEPTMGARDTSLGSARYVSVPVSVGDSTGVLVATALTAVERQQVESAVRIAIGVSLVVLLLASLFIWLAAGRAIAPLQALSRMARTISETDLSSRIPVRGNDEIADLGRTFNGMLDRLETAFADQKDFLTDVSHELRTPITVIRGHLETVGDSPAEREEAIAVSQDELDRMSRYVDDLLLLTKAARPDFLRLGPIDLDLFTHDVFAKARILGDRDWRLDGTGVGIVVADDHRLTQAMMNLAENAVRHTSAGETIWLGSSVVGRQARLWVRDEGPGVDPADRERIFARYARAGSATRRASDGAGLGLSIVRAITEAHDGRVELESRPGMGSTFTIVLPSTPEP